MGRSLAMVVLALLLAGCVAPQTLVCKVDGVEVFNETGNIRPPYKNDSWWVNGGYYLPPAGAYCEVY